MKRHLFILVSMFTLASLANGQQASQKTQGSPSRSIVSTSAPVLSARLQPAALADGQDQQPSDPDKKEAKQEKKEAKQEKKQDKKQEKEDEKARKRQAENQKKQDEKARKAEAKD